MVVCWQQVQCPARLFHGTAYIAEGLGAKGPGEGDRTRQRPELLRIHNHHPDRCGSSGSVARVARRLGGGCIKPPLGIVQSGRAASISPTPNKPKARYVLSTGRPRTSPAG